MSAATAIPEEVMQEAWRLWRDDERDDGPTIIAGAILAERERCAKIADALSAMQVTDCDDAERVAFACFNEAASQRADMIASAIRGGIKP